MSLRHKYLKILSGIAPAGAGVVLLLGSAMPSAAARHPAGADPSATNPAGVAERLTAIREAVSDAAKAESEAVQPGEGELRLAWGNWWRNWWRNW